MIEWFIVGGIVLGSLFGDNRTRPRRDSDLHSILERARRQREGALRPPVATAPRPSKMFASPPPSTPVATDYEKAPPAPQASHGNHDNRVAEGPVSTSHLARSLGLSTNRVLFDELLRRALIRRVDGKYELTEDGGCFGSYAFAENGGRYIVWNRERISPALGEFVTTHCATPAFRLYHMTHVANVPSILEKGLMSHRTAPAYCDISNVTVNGLRAAIVTVHGRSLHDYVPLYFNPRNAMLYQKQKEYRQDIVIVEISKSVCHEGGVLFSEGNAASSESRIVDTLAATSAFNWPRIVKEDWREGRILNLTTKRLMMSECLVPNQIAAARIIRLHAPDAATGERLARTQPRAGRVELRTSPELFFHDNPPVSSAANRH